MNYDIFEIGNIITDFRKKPPRWGSLEEWMGGMCHTYLITGKKETINRKNYTVKRLDNLTGLESPKSYDALLEIDVKTYLDYRKWNKEEVEGLYEQMKKEWELEKVEIEQERIEQERENKELAKASDETIKEYFENTKSIIKTAEHFKRDLLYVWNLLDDDTLQENAEDYDEAMPKAKRLEKTNKNKVILVNAIYDTPAYKDGLGLGLEGLDAESRQQLYKFLGYIRNSKSKKGGSKSKKSPKKEQIEKQLYKFAENGNVQKLKELLENKGVKFDINWTNLKENGNTALHVAVDNRYDKVVELLLANDATVNKMNNDGKNPLHIACKKYGIPSIVKLLIDKGANVNEPEHNAFENTPLHLAAMNRTDFGFLGSNAGNEANEEIATILLEAGADPELKNAKEQTVMELAESRRNHWVVEILKNFPKKKLHEATIGVLTQKGEPLSKKVIGNQYLNSEIKSYLGGKKRSKRYKKAGRKTRKEKKINKLV